MQYRMILKVVLNKSFTKDEGRPFGVGFQEQAPNHLKWL